MVASPATRRTSQLSLLDTPNSLVREWWLVYHPRPDNHYAGARWLKQGFRHVELTRPLQYGPGINDVLWLNVLPSFAFVDVDMSYDPRPPWVKCPGSQVQKVVSVLPRDSIRSWFDIGPPTCVEAAKQALGISAFWVRTPWQLFNHIQKRGCVIHGRRQRGQFGTDSPTAAAGDSASGHEREPQP